MDSGILIGIIGVIIGIISIIISYILFKKGLKIKQPLFAIESNGFGDIPKELPKLSLTYDGKKINYYTVSRIAIWNSGKETINANDIVTSDKIRIIAEDGYEFLEANVLSEINPLNKFEINYNSKEIIVDFDYIDYNQGCCIEVHHTGKTSWSIQVAGTIKGSGAIKQASHISYPKRREKAFLFSIITFFIGSLVSFLIYGWDDHHIVEKIISINGFIALLVYGIGPLFISFLFYKRNRIPITLGVTDDDQALRAPDFPPTGRTRERDKDANPTW